MSRLPRLPLRARVTFAVLAALAAVAGGCTSTRERDAPAARPVVERAFPSAPDPRAPAVVWALGDGGDGSEEARLLAARVAAAAPDRVLYLGDVYDHGSAAEFRENFAAVYGRLARRMAPTPGNHDWPAHREGYDPYWRSVTGVRTPPWYAFRIGGWRLISLNSETPTDRRQLRWLRRELDRAFHIHAKVHLDRQTVLTTQLYFDDGVSDAVYRDAAYADRGSREQLNGSDGIFDDSLLLTLEESGAGYLGLMTFDVQAA